MATMIRITSKKDGFRRAGIAHRGSVDYPAKRFTAAQLDTLKAEPTLIVQEVEVADKKEGK